MDKMRKLFVAMFIMVATASHADIEVQLEALATGTLNVYELMWSSPDAVECHATGDWSGSRPWSGVELVTVSGTMTFGMVCRGGETSTLSWVPPTARVNNVPLDITELAGFGVFAGYASNSLELVAIVEPPATTYIFDQTQEGTRYYAVTAIDTGGLESEKSRIASKAIVFPTGDAPEVILTQASNELRIVGTTVYTIVKRIDRFLLLPVGNAPPDTVCIESQQVNGYYVVPRTAVTWSGTTKPDVVVAQCEYR